MNATGKKGSSFKYSANLRLSAKGTIVVVCVVLQRCIVGTKEEECMMDYIGE